MYSFLMLFGLMIFINSFPIIYIFSRRKYKSVIVTLLAPIIPIMLTLTGAALIGIGLNERDGYMGYVL